MEENVQVNNSPEINVSDKTFSGLERVMGMLGKYGPLKMIGAVIFFVFFSWMAYLAVNPGVIFERYDQYVTNKHNASVDYRMETSPVVRAYLNQLAMETGAERAYILEFHNGKSNPSGLQWQFGDLTFISDNTDDISDEIQNVALSRYSFANLVHDNGYWVGGIDELAKLDERFYQRMLLNGGVYFAFQVIYGSNMREIGILGISFLEGEEVPPSTSLIKVVHKYSSSIAPLLDESNAPKK